MEIGHNESGYFLVNTSDMTFDNKDKTIAKLLGMEFERYEKLLIKYGGVKIKIAVGCEGEYYFKTKKNIEIFLNSDELLPYLMMLKLDVKK